MKEHERVVRGSVVQAVGEHTDGAVAGPAVEHHFDPGVRAVVLAVLVTVVAGALTLPWLGSRSGWELLFDGDGQGKIGGIGPRVFAALVVACAVLGTPLALWIRRYGAGWLVELGCDVTWLFGGLSIWSQQSSSSHQPGPGPGIGLILSEPAMILLALAWASIVWRRPPTGATRTNARTAALAAGLAHRRADGQAQAASERTRG